jgi:hypothetical protein
MGSIVLVAAQPFCTLHRCSKETPLQLQRPPQAWLLLKPGLLSQRPAPGMAAPDPLVAMGDFALVTPGLSDLPVTLPILRLFTGGCVVGGR